MGQRIQGESVDVRLVLAIVIVAIWARVALVAMSKIRSRRARHRAQLQKP
jgi:hypothetical protein